MAVKLAVPDSQALLSVPGVRIGVASVGVRKAGRDDLVILLAEPGSTAAGVFTRNRFCAAPVQVCQSHFHEGSDVRALVINTGNANAGTGAQGLVHAKETCRVLAGLVGCEPRQVFPFSTGVIMEPMPIERILGGLPIAFESARGDSWLAAARAIMTTDTVPKAVSEQVTIGGTCVSITGIAKGAGMIRPNMATMLGFVVTDAAIAAPTLRAMVRAVADQSFNRITVDGDTSTNDSFVIVATHKAQHTPIQSMDDPDGKLIYDALCRVGQRLAQAIVRDGEGATKFITIQVNGGGTEDECQNVAYAVAHSPLVKTAFYAKDPNLGRILAAVGYAGIPDLDPSTIDLFLDEVHVATQGGRHPRYREEDGQRVMKNDEIQVRIELGRGTCSSTVWTCDLSHEYVTVNADYRS